MSANFLFSFMKAFFYYRRQNKTFDFDQYSFVGIIKYKYSLQQAIDKSLEYKLRIMTKV